MRMRPGFPAILSLNAITIVCATQNKMLAQRQPDAVQTVLASGQFDLNWLQATATVLSSDYIQPRVLGPWVSVHQLVEYTVVVVVCNQQTSYVMLCQVGSDSCFAAHPRDTFQGVRQQ